MRFLLGVIAGFAAGLAVARFTGGRSSAQLRAEFERFRAEVQKGDVEALSSHLEERFKELQGGLDARLSAFSDAAGRVAQDASRTAQDKADAAGSTAAKARADVAIAVEDLTKA